MKDTQIEQRKQEQEGKREGEVSIVGSEGSDTVRRGLCGVGGQAQPPPPCLQWDGNLALPLTELTPKISHSEVPSLRRKSLGEEGSRRSP